MRHYSTENVPKAAREAPLSASARAAGRIQGLLYANTTMMYVSLLAKE